MLSRPPSRIASRAFTTRFSTTCSICEGSARIRHSPGSSSITRSRSSPISRRSIGCNPPHHLAQSSTLASRICLRLKRQQLPRQARGAIHRLRDELEVVPARIIRLQAHGRDVATPPDHRQQVVEVVRDPAREPPDRLQLLRLPQLLLQLLALRDVRRQRHRPDDAPAAVAQRRRRTRSAPPARRPSAAAAAPPPPAPRPAAAAPAAPGTPPHRPGRPRAAAADHLRPAATRRCAPPPDSTSAPSRPRSPPRWPAAPPPTTASSVWLDSRQRPRQLPPLDRPPEHRQQVLHLHGLDEIGERGSVDRPDRRRQRGVPGDDDDLGRGEAVLIAWSTSSPDMSGSMMSRIATSVGALTSCSSAACARWNTRDVVPPLLQHVGERLCRCPGHRRR